jgi:hypothetical protein
MTATFKHVRAHSSPQEGNPRSRPQTNIPASFGRRDDGRTIEDQRAAGFNRDAGKPGLAGVLDGRWPIDGKIGAQILLRLAELHQHAATACGDAAGGAQLGTPAPACCRCPPTPSSATMRPPTETAPCPTSSRPSASAAASPALGDILDVISARASRPSGADGGQKIRGDLLHADDPRPFFSIKPITMRSTASSPPDSSVRIVGILPSVFSVGDLAPFRGGADGAGHDDALDAIAKAPVDGREIADADDACIEGRSHPVGLVLERDDQGFSPALCAASAT